EMLHDPARDRRRERGDALSHLLELPHKQVLGLLLEQIALCAGRERTHDRGVVAHHGGDDADSLGAQEAQIAQYIETGPVRQAEIDQRDVVVARRRLGDAGAHARCFVNLGLLESRADDLAQPAAGFAQVLDDEYFRHCVIRTISTGNCASIRVPSAPLAMLIRPPRLVTRACMLASPLPVWTLEGSKPPPSSATVKAMASSSRRIVTLIASGCPCLSAFCTASRTTERTVCAAASGRIAGPAVSTSHFIFTPAANRFSEICDRRSASISSKARSGLEALLMMSRRSVSVSRIIMSLRASPRLCSAPISCTPILSWMSRAMRSRSSATPFS